MNIKTTNHIDTYVVELIQLLHRPRWVQKCVIVVSISVVQDNILYRLERYYPIHKLDPRK